MKRLFATFLVFTLILTSMGVIQSQAAMPIISTEDETPIFLSPMNSAVPQSAEPMSSNKAELPFVDVSSGSWFYEDVRYVYTKGIMTGASDTKFLPYKELTRGEAVTVLYRMAGSPSVSGTLSFEDVKSGTFYYNAVLWASGHGVVNGTSPTRFRPGNNITRQQIAAILHRYYSEYLGLVSSAEDDLSGFADKELIQSYGRIPLAWAVGSGIMKGVSHDGAMELQPNGNTNRAQMATLLHRLSNLIEGSSDSTEPSEPVPTQPQDPTEPTDPTPTQPEDPTEPNDPTEPTAPEEDDNPYGLSSYDIIEFIKLREGFDKEPYWDYGQWTVGYGICCRDDEGNRCTKYSDYSKIAEKYFHLTEEEGEILLLEELASDYEVSVSKFAEKYGLDFSQNEFDSLVSFTFNLGAAWTSQSYKLSRCLAGTEEYADGYTELEFMDAMGSWCRVGGSIAPGTCKRRIIEASIFLYDDYATDADNANFCYARYKGNGSYLTVGSNGSGYDDAIDYYVRGLTYGTLLTPVWTPINGANSITAAHTPQDSSKTFVGWYTNDGMKITTESVAEKNQVLTARWE